jgi:LmbE family N-acetylglucosaminyl deacetylase
MKPVGIARPGERLSVLCIGAHSDDIEIGAGATILGWIEKGIQLDVHWAVLSAAGARSEEAQASALSFLVNAHSAEIDLADFQDGFFPYQGAAIKAWFEQLRRRTSPDVILCHWHNDAHQDHRQVSALTWNTFRDHPILEYEIPKWDGDIGRPNVYVPVSRELMARKTELLQRHFGSQRSKDWFEPETYLSLARLRGVECRASEGFAEAFHARKLSFH